MDKIEKLYNKKIIKSGDRLEIYKYQSYQRIGGESKNRGGRGGKEELSQEQKEINKEQSKRQNLYKARNTIIRLVNCNKDLTTFITLTYAIQPHDLKESKKNLDDFFKRLKRKYKELKYLYVLEYGGLKGRLHYHVLTNFLLPVNIIFAESNQMKSMEHKEYENYFSSSIWKHGFVDIRNLDAEGNNNVGLYVSCYLVEDLFKLDLQGHKCYGYSRNLDRPHIKKINSKSKEYVISEDSYNLKFVNSYKIKYIDKEGKDRTSKVVYSDYYKNRR